VFKEQAVGCIAFPQTNGTYNCPDALVMRPLRHLAG
jgi:hypothetical protein